MLGRQNAELRAAVAGEDLPVLRLPAAAAARTQKKRLRCGAFDRTARGRRWCVLRSTAFWLTAALW